jgi:nucleoside-diphosphate-sugar epimerase
MLSQIDLKRVVMTGPTGAVGIALINELTANGIAVTAVCRPNSKRIASLPKCPLVSVVECELDNLSLLADTLCPQYDAFFHFGWDGTYGASRMDIKLQMQNLSSTVHAVELAQALGCQVFIGAGSQSEFGHIDGVMRPDAPCNPDNGYGIAKLASGMISRVMCSAVGIRHIWCRIISLFGPYDGEHTLIMSTISKLLAEEQPEFTKAEQIWDYIYSKDAARAFRLVAEKGVHGSIYCLGSGRPRMLRDFISVICRELAPEKHIVFGGLPYYPNQVMCLKPDISNLKADVGFEPEYSFEQGICETVQWARGKNGHC